MHTVGLTTAYYHCMLHLDNILLPGIYISLPPLTSQHNKFFHVKISFTLLLQARLVVRQCLRGISINLESWRVGGRWEVIPNAGSLAWHISYND